MCYVYLNWRGVICLITTLNNMIPWGCVLKEQIIAQPLKKFCPLTEPKDSLPCSRELVSEHFMARSIQSTTPHPIYLISILISPYHLHLVLPSVFFLSVFFRPNACINFLIALVRVLWRAHPILLDLVILMIFGVEYYEACQHALFSASCFKRDQKTKKSLNWKRSSRNLLI